MVVSVSHSIDYMNKNKITEDVKKLEAKRREVTDSINILKNLRSVYSQEKEMILTNKSIGGDNGVNINDLQNAASFFRTRLTEIETNSFKIDKKSIALKEKLVDISKQLMEINSKTDLPSSQIKLVISAERAVETKIEVDYLIGDATWTPTYDIRIKDIDNPLVLTYKAKVNQNSGEDWNDVNLTLSTGNPSVSNTKPTLDTYFLTFNNYYSDIKPLYRPSNQRFTGRIEGFVVDDSTGEPLIGCNVMVKGTTIGTVSDAQGRFALDVPTPNSTISLQYIGYNPMELPAGSSFNGIRLKEASQELEETVVIAYGISEKKAFSGSAAEASPMKNIIPIAIQKQQTSTEFKIDVPYTIPSDNKDYDVSMVQYNIPASYSYYAVPKLSDDVYLVARITDWNQYNMLNGNANLFFKDIYQGDSFLDLKSFDDTLTISVGRDKDIIVDREIQKDFTTKNYISNNKRELKGWNINIKNNKSNTINLVVEDQFPISRTADIKVDLLEHSGALTDNETGKVTWNLQINPNEKRVLNLKYSVRYPKDKKVIVE
jgi:hypothetical protein